MAHDEVKIAERVYGGRMGNRPEGSGDGFKYRGRGLLQITGAGMFRKARLKLGSPYDDQPDLICQPQHAAMVSAWVWEEEKCCNILADAGQFSATVKRINGGFEGLDDRLAWLDKVNEALA